MVTGPGSSLQTGFGDHLIPEPGGSFQKFDQ